VTYCVILLHVLARHYAVKLRQGAIGTSPGVCSGAVCPAQGTAEASARGSEIGEWILPHLLELRKEWQWGTGGEAVDMVYRDQPRRVPPRRNSSDTKREALRANGGPPR
jgi:hypothetical protein